MAWVAVPWNEFAERTLERPILAASGGVLVVKQDFAVESPEIQPSQVRFV